MQEKIHPLATIENVKAQSKNKPAAEQQLTMFADFNGIDWEDQINFYQHEQNWTNRLILGDSLQVMASLADREGLKGQVQMIYIDPPYGIKFSSNWQVSTQDKGVKESVKGLTRQPEQIKAFRDTWELGIHSYLAYLRDRFVAAQALLTETGSIFVQIGAENAHLVRCLLDEIFGSKNFISEIIFSKTSSATSSELATINDYILWYAKDKSIVKYRKLFQQKPSPIGNPSSKYDQVQLIDGTRRAMSADEKAGYVALPPKARIYRLSGIDSQTGTENTRFPLNFNNKIYFPSGARGWSTSQEGFNNLTLANRLQSGKTTLNYIRFFDDHPIQQLTNVWMDIGGAVQSRSDPKIYVVQTGMAPVQRCILMATDPGDLVLDPTCGAGTTSYTAELWGRRWITIDTSRVALALARTRLMSAGFPYYLLVDIESKDLRTGFKNKTAPHIMLKNIANNNEIFDISNFWQEKLAPIHGRLNQLLNKNWQEREVPREAKEAWSLEAKQLLTQYWEQRQKCQTEMDESIARNSEQETLYDQPYTDPKVIRVTGPFTVESLSPYKPISPAAASAQPTSERTAQEQGNVGKYEQLIIDNLREAGVQNTKQGERLEFDILELAEGGIHIQGEGEYTDKNEKVKRVAVCIGPEHGTVGKDLIKAAANEAVKGISADLLLVCGFSFDPNVSEETKQYGRLTVLPVRMNPDLTMASLLKKTDKANLFMVFGEPDVNIEYKDGKVIVTLNGLDIYDPTTGEIRSSSTKDIACWFIDTNYDGNSFFVRHAYFTGAGDPYNSLKRALKAEINQEAWKALYKTTSMPFDPPETGNIAIKVINHYGDEVLQVYRINNKR